MRRPGECDPSGPGRPGGLGTMRAMDAAPPGPSLSVDAPDEAEQTGGATRGDGGSTSRGTRRTEAAHGSAPAAGVDAVDPEGPPFSRTTVVLLIGGTVVAVAGWPEDTHPRSGAQQ